MKYLKVCLVFLLILMISSCDMVEKDSLIELVTSYQSKIISLIESDEDYNPQMSTQNVLLSFNEDDPNYITRETYLETYAVQRDNAQDVQLSPHLMIYKDLLDDVLDEIEAQNIQSIEAQIYVNFRDLLDLDAYVSITSDQGILIKLNLTFQGNHHYYGIKMGYEGTDFYLRELQSGLEQNRFEYFEFLENHQMIDIRYTQESYWYRYQNQNDNTYYEISKENSMFYNDYVLSWFNPETNIRTRIIRTGEGHMNHIEFFNVQGIYFVYTDYLDSENIDVAWQLLEATGWDGVYHEHNTPNPLNGIYKDGVKILDGVRMNSDLNINFANVFIQKSMLKSELTNEMINLSAYGLHFSHQEIDLALIESVISNSMNESSHLSVYRGIDFLNDDLSEVLYAEIDPDIKP